MTPTIHDVAARAGVSISTVSRVLNKSASVRESKRVRVEEAAAALGYRPNPAALSLLNRRLGGVGVLLPYIAGDFFSDFLRGIDRFTSERELFLMVSSSHRSTGEMKAVVQGLKQRVDGLVVMSTEVPAKTVCEWIPSTLPVVFVNTDVAGSDAETFNFDSRAGGYRVTQHLIERGHRRVSFLTGPEGSWDGIERREGYRAALAEHGLEPGPELPGDYTMESGEAAAALLVAADPRPTAVFAANDDSAFGILTGLRAAGLSVPGDIAVAGFDDIKLSQLAMPSLTTIHVPVGEMGRAAIERLVARIDGAPAAPSRVTMLPTELVVRESTGGAA